MESKWFNEYDYLKQSIENGKSYEKLGREYGCSGSNIKKVTKKLGIELPQRRIVNPKENFGRKIRICKHCGKEFVKKDGYSDNFCSNECYTKYKHQKAYNEFLEHPEKYARANYSPRRFKDFILKEQGGTCAICGMKPEWNGKELVFIIDHIDGHASNNSRSNLRAICPNCDSQLDTYKSKNKNGDRSYYRYKKT